MDTFNLIFIVIMFIGFAVIIFSIIKINKYNNAKPISLVDTSIKEMNEAIDKADLAIDDLNILSEEIFKRFDEKQQQLLFLYNAVQKNQISPNAIDIKINTDENMNKLNKKPIKAHPMAPKISEMLEKGMSVPDIASSLNMGQGEVKLIIELGKDSL